MVPLIALAALALGATLQFMGGAAAQQMFPTRTVRFILPFGAGSASDTTARLFAFVRALGQAGSGGESSWR
jgi:tripartite-type tricarboxylate transporter receptor subunit TctC